MTRIQAITAKIEAAEKATDAIGNTLTTLAAAAIILVICL